VSGPRKSDQDPLLARKPLATYRHSKKTTLRARREMRGDAPAAVPQPRIA